MKNYDVTYNAGRTCPMELRGRSGWESNPISSVRKNINMCFLAHNHAIQSIV